MPNNFAKYKCWSMHGEYTLEHCLDRLDAMTNTLQVATLESELPDTPDYGRINDWLSATYLDWWRDEMLLLPVRSGDLAALLKATTS